jgi:hypothetical protein
MTGLIVIDESGDLGSAGSTYFTICSIVSPSSRVLLPAARLLPKGNLEKKFYTSSEQEIIPILNLLSTLPIDITFVSTEKNHPADGVFIYGNELYHRSLRDLLDQSLKQMASKDVHIIVDGNRYIKQIELRSMCEELCRKYGKNLKKCYKGISQNEPCLRIVDYVAGSIRFSFEQDNDKYRSIIENKVSVARRY